MTESPSGAGIEAVAVRGLLSTGTSQVAQIVLQFVSLAVLARLLTPKDFGIVAMVLVVIGIAEIFRDLGLSSAAVQARELSDGLRSNLFWANTAIGALLTAMTMASAPAIAAAYGVPELVPVAVALAPTFLLSGLATQYRVDLARRLRFKTLGLLVVVTPLVAVVAAIVAALAGLGYWALIVQQLVGGLVTLVFLVSVCRWLPGRPRRGTGLRALLRVGASFLGSSVLTYVKWNVDSFVIGRQFGTEAIGLYNRSIQTVRTPLKQLQQPFGSVVLPMAARQRDDDEAFLSTIRQFQPVMTYGLCAVAAVVAAAPEAIVSIILGERWLAAAPAMAAVAAAAAIAAAGSPVAWIYTARGHADALLGFTALTTIVTVACVLAGARYGMSGVALGYLAATVAGFPLTFLRASTVSGLPLRRLFLDCLRPVLLMGAAWLLTTTITSSTSLGTLAGLPVAIACTAAVALAAACVRSVRSDYARIAATVCELRGAVGVGNR